MIKPSHLFLPVAVTVAATLSAQQPAANPNAGALAVTPAPTLPTTSALVSVTGYDDHALFTAAAGGTTLVDFEAILTGTTITNQLIPDGILSVSGTSAYGNGLPFQAVTASTALPFPMFQTGTLPSETNFISNDLASPHYACGTMTFSFVTPRTSVGAFVADQGPLANFEIEVFLLGVSQGTISVGPRTLPSSFVGLVSTVPFTDATFRSATYYDSWGLDNLEHGICSPAFAQAMADTGNRNAPNSISAWPLANLPQIGNATFAIRLSDPTNACGLTNTALAGLGVSLHPGSALLGGFGCGPGIAGEIMLGVAQSFALIGVQQWNGGPAVFQLPIPAAPWACNVNLFAQGFWLDAQATSAPGVLSWRLDMVLGF